MDSKPGRPRKGLKRDGRQSLLTAARDLIREEGIERLTIRAVADRAGAGTALVSYYFGSKEGLKEAVVEEVVTELRERILVDEVRGRTASEDLHGIIVQLIMGLGKEPYVARLLVELIVSGDTVILEKLVKNVALPNLEIIAEIFKRGHRRGEFAADEIDLLLPLVMGASTYPIIIAPLCKAVLGLDFDDPEHLLRYANHTADTLIRALAPEK